MNHSLTLDDVLRMKPVLRARITRDEYFGVWWQVREVPRLSFVDMTLHGQTDPFAREWRADGRVAGIGEQGFVGAMLYLRDPPMLTAPEIMMLSLIKAHWCEASVVENQAAGGQRQPRGKRKAHEIVDRAMLGLRDKGLIECRTRLIDPDRSTHVDSKMVQVRRWPMNPPQPSNDK